MNTIDLTGCRFGRLVVQCRTPKSECKSNEIWFTCRCDCGSVINVRGRHLRYGKVKSCGCLEKENRERLCQDRITHGESKTRLYRTWNGMNERCNNPNNSRYASYGGRGITVCDEWKKYESFRDWSVNNGYEDGLSIDRIDNDKGYCPENCRWITLTQQANNKRTNTVFNDDGVNKTIAELSKEYHIPYDTLFARLKYYHWSFEKAITQGVRNVGKKVSVNSKN